MTAVADRSDAAPRPRAIQDAPVSGRAAVLLDVLMGLSVVAGLLRVAQMDVDPRVPGVWAAGYLAVVLAMVALWVLRRAKERRSGRPARGLVVAFAVIGLVGLFVGEGPGTWPLFVMALLAVVSATTPMAGVVLLAVVLAAQAGLFVIIGRGLAETAGEVATTAYVFGFVLVLAWLVAEHAVQRQQIGELLAQVRSGRAAEVELVLADERTRSARNLHDGLGHRLSVISMSLQFAERMRERDPERAWAQVTSARTQAGEALTTMRRWVRALSPVRVDGSSTAEALDAIAESFRGTGLEVVVRAPDAEEVSDRGVTLYVHRFVQEGLTNVLRHSAARRVDVECAVVGGVLLLGVRDDGSPGTVDRGAPTSGFGLRSLAARAAELGGSVTTSWSSAGFELRARLPITAGRRAA